MMGELNRQQVVAMWLWGDEDAGVLQAPGHSGGRALAWNR